MALKPGMPNVSQSRDHHRAKKAGLETMREYALSRPWRRRILLGYLGEEISTGAGCDRCTKGGLRYVSQRASVVARSPDTTSAR